MPKKPETAIVKKIMDYLEARGDGFWFKTHGGAYQILGLPDIVGCLEGKFIGIEVKQPGEEPTEKQKEIMRLIRNSGGTVGVATSLSEVKVILWGNE